MENATSTPKQLGLVRLQVFGDNRVGQAGIASPDEVIELPTDVSHIDFNYNIISRIAVSQNQLFVVFSNGTVFTSGENDSNELGRSGKRSLLQRVDALETFQISEVALGLGFALLLGTDGKVIGWGRNEMGQLGLKSIRENREKPRTNPTITEPLIQISCGAQHTVALTRYGKVISWGGNYKGQLGDGQLSSSTTPIPILQLRHRPVVAVSCGENHTIVMTVGGNIYAWGDNSQGQLGMGDGDTTNRLRPQLVKSLRSIRARKICAGGQHSAVISSLGLLFTFGSNGFGQCGNDSDVRVCSSPTIVDRLRDYMCLQVACGAAHTVVVVGQPSARSPSRYNSSTSSSTSSTSSSTSLCSSVGGGPTIGNAVFVMGLNSSGQLGLGHCNNVYFPSKLTVNGGGLPIGIASGPLSRQTLLVTLSDEEGTLQQQLQQSRSQTLQHNAPMIPQLDRCLLPAVNLGLVQQLVSNAAVSETQGVNALRTSIAAAFSSISVLNASFTINSLSGGGSSSSSSDNLTAAVDHSALTVDLHAVRVAYKLIMNTEHELPAGRQIISTLGRATMLLTEQLRECPFDDSENLAVFLVALENPLMLRAKEFHIAIERLVSGILAVPKYYRLILFKWLKSYPSEYFGRVLQVLQGYLSYGMENHSLNFSPAPVVMVLETLYECNKEMHIVPEELFYNDSVIKIVNLVAEWQSFKSSPASSQVFNFWSYPFLIRDTSKYAILMRDFRERAQNQVFSHKRKYLTEPYLKYWINEMRSTRNIQFAIAGQPQSQQPASGNSIVPISLPTGMGVSLQEVSLYEQQQRRFNERMQELLSTSTNNSVDGLAEGGLEGGGRRPIQGPLPPPPVPIPFSSLSSLSSAATVYLNISVRRSHLLCDFLSQLRQIIHSDASTLRLPLRVEFEGEDGLDAGGVTKELLTLAVRALSNAVLAPCSDGRTLWFNHTNYRSIKKTAFDTTSAAAAVTDVEKKSFQGGGLKEDATAEDESTIHDILSAIDPVYNQSSTKDGHSMDNASDYGSCISRNPSFETIVNDCTAFASKKLKTDTSHSNSTTTTASTTISVEAYKRTPEYYLGVMVGLAATNGVFVEMPLPKSVYKIFAAVLQESSNNIIINNNNNSSATLSLPRAGDIKLALSDLYDVDSALASGLQFLLDFEGGAGALEEMLQVSFVSSPNPLVSTVASYGAPTSSATLEQEAGATSDTVVELVPGGENTPVNKGNRQRFVDLFVQHALYRSCKHQVAAYLHGLKLLFHGPMVESCCTSLELEHVLCGMQDIGDLSDLRLQTLYRGEFNDEHVVINWFWDVLSSLSPTDKRKFLHFLSGSERIPLGGLSRLGFTIQSTKQSPLALPVAHTCFNTLDLPCTYTSREQLRDRLMLALQYSEGFGLI